MKITKEDKFRSTPGINSDYNMVRFTVDCNFYEARRLREFVHSHEEQNIIDAFEYIDPNLDPIFQDFLWTKLIITEKIMARNFKEGKFRVENWICGTPGDEDGWATVSRWVYFLGLELKPKIKLKLGGMCELRKEDSDNIYKKFLGDYFEPKTSC